ncbi:MAG: betaine/proline/choline family ABC transporter ATP-binding protein [Ilumatobacter sp.]|uniref:betaine/proline/choline family ABC transporter ATP-binding protein n=1 Tax=Ilumatobacter sp. TaxID=1967498 RepID=UPI00391874EF
MDGRSGRSRPVATSSGSTSSGATSSGATSIRLTEVTKVFAGSTEPAVDRLSLDIDAGTITALLGPSGCGKTTTLRMINRLVEPTAGTIEIDGVDILGRSPQELRRSIGYVIQQVGLFPHRTIASNVATVPDLLGWDRKRTAERVEELTTLVGLDHDLLSRYPDELSGGQQQRVGVARALAADPPVLLMDEPFGAVDPIVRSRLQDELLDLQSKVRKTIVLVTHDLDEALRIADRIALLNVGGILEQVATPDDLMSAPANDFVASFIGDERGLRRLSLKTVSGLRHHQGPVVADSADLADVEAVLAAEMSEWLGITVDERFVGWVHADDARAAFRAHGRLDTDALQVPAAQVQPDSTLRAAMELIMNANSSAAVIDDDGRFGGVVTLEDIRRSLGAQSP